MASVIFFFSFFFFFPGKTTSSRKQYLVQRNENKTAIDNNPHYSPVLTAQMNKRHSSTDLSSGFILLTKQTKNLLCKFVTYWLKMAAELVFGITEEGKTGVKVIHDL